MRSFKIGLIFILAFIFNACATGSAKYYRPSAPSALENSTILNKSKDEVWKEIIPALGRNFFVINNLDKASGIINISYIGDPEEYVECGRLHYQVNDPQGSRTYDFPAAKEYKEYKMALNGNSFIMKRRMALEGRMNIIFEEIGPNKTRVTVNTRYILTRTIQSQQIGNPYSATDTNIISFNSGQRKSFPGKGSYKGTTCQPTGDFERSVLYLLTGH